MDGLTLADLTTAQWTFALVGAFLLGISKGGVPGVGNLTIALFALAFPAKASVGILLPVLISADIVAVIVYRRHVLWPHVLRLFPGAAVGVGIGWLLLGRMDDATVALVIGIMLLVMTAFHLIRRYQLRDGREDRLPGNRFFLAGMGTAVGTSSMLANAAGPLAAIYLMAARLPKLAFIGTGAWFFFLLNLFKLPFQATIGVVDFPSLQLSFAFAPLAVLGALLGPLFVKMIPQKVFEALVWFFILVAAVKLLLSTV